MAWRCLLAALVAASTALAFAATAEGMSFGAAAARSHDDALALWAQHQNVLPAGAVWPSQLGQDRWAATFAFPPHAYDAAHADAAPQYFVEVGAADGLDLSNSFALEAHLGWRGLCVEASPSSVALLRANRPLCTVVDAVVGARSGEAVNFTSFPDAARRLFSGVAAHEYYHLFGGAGELDAAARARLNLLKGGTPDDGGASGGGGGSVVVTRTTESLADLLDRRGAPLHVDFLSLDCEGLEADVLASFPFHRRTFGSIVVDHGHTPSKRARLLQSLAAAGYVRTGCLDHDDAYVPRASLEANPKSSLAPLSSGGHGDDYRGLSSSSSSSSSRRLGDPGASSPPGPGGTGGTAASDALPTEEGAQPEPWLWEPVLADTAEACDAATTAMVQVACAHANGSVAFATPRHAAAAQKVCAAADLGAAACEATVLGRARAHCFGRAPGGGLSGGSSGGTEVYTFPLRSDRASPANFTLLRIQVQLSDSLQGAGAVSLTFPLLPRRADRAAAARAIARLFCSRTAWANDGKELESFLVASVEGWVDRERARALATADATRAESAAAATAQRLREYAYEGAG